MGKSTFGGESTLGYVNADDFDKGMESAVSAGKDSKYIEHAPCFKALEFL